MSKNIGVFQGCVLGPLLFTIIVNNLFIAELVFSMQMTPSGW